MYGYSINTLNVYKDINGDETLLWQLTGDKGNNWNYGKVPVEENSGNLKVGHCQHLVITSYDSAETITFLSITFNFIIE